jgi:hypothetical protein
MERLMKAELREVEVSTPMDVFQGTTDAGADRVTRWKIHALYLALAGGTPPSSSEHLGIRIHAGYDISAGSAGTFAFSASGPVDSPYHHDAVYPIEQDFSDINFAYTLLADEDGTNPSFYSDIAAAAKFSDGWNIQTPYKKVWGEDERPVIDDYRDSGFVTGLSRFWVVRLTPAPSVQLLLNAMMIFERQTFRIS